MELQKNALALDLEALKKEKKDSDVDVAAQKLTTSVQLVREEIERALEEEVQRLGGEFADHRYETFRKKIQKLYPDLDISRVDEPVISPPKGAPVEAADPKQKAPCQGSLVLGLL